MRKSTRIVSFIATKSISLLKIHCFSYIHCQKTPSESHASPEQKEKLDKTNQLAEMLCKDIYFMVVKIGVPGLALPKAILSFYKYYGTNARNDAFELAVPL